MKNRTKIWLTILAVAIVIALGIYWYSIKSKVMSGLHAPQNQVLDETQDWKTYRNEEYGFEFKLPVEYSLARKNDINGDDYAEDYRYKNDYSRYFSIGVISSERIRQNALTLTGEDYHLNPVTLLSIIKEYRSYNAYLSSEVRGKRNTTINTYPAIEQEEQTISDSGSNDYLITYILKDGKLIKLVGSDNMSREEYSKILSTFKFTK